MSSTQNSRETMNIVIVGHVDHGKSTLVGRLLADTGVLGDGKLERVMETCRQQGKVFEYAFLLDALEAEQQQGITIDAARVFFRTDLRDYIIIDAPGHIEFLKNMVTGAARAQAAILLIDAKEGVRENSRRHGYLLSMLGIRQVIVAINKMDLVDFSQEVYNNIVKEYTDFLSTVEITPQVFVPMAARSGDNVANRSKQADWYDGPTVLEAVDRFNKEAARSDLPLRMPVQDVYKFNQVGDDRRLVAGRIESGKVRVGDRVLFSPSNKSAKVASIEEFNAPKRAEVEAGYSTAITLDQEIYVARGDVMSHVQDAPCVSTLMRINLFWLGREPFRKDKKYKIKLGTAETQVTIHEIRRVLDASSLDADTVKPQVERHDVADLVLRTRHPIAFDPSSKLEGTGRFVIVDGYDIAGGGIVRELVADESQQTRLESKIRDLEWVRGDVTPAQRADILGHRAFMIMFAGDAGTGKHALARMLEQQLVPRKINAYLLDGKNVFLGVDADLSFDNRQELVRRYGEVAHVLLDAGNIVVSTTNVIGLTDHGEIAARVSPFPMFTVSLGALDSEAAEVDLALSANIEPQAAVARVLARLEERGLISAPTS